MTRAGRGILYPARLPEFHRLPAPEPVAALVRWFWVPEWDLEPGRTSRQDVVAYPASNLVVEAGLVGLAGPTTRRSHRDLTGRGWAVGALLRPAAVPGFTDEPAALRDRYLPVPADDLRQAVAAAMTSRDRPGHRERAVDACAAWLMARVPEPSAEARLANAMADLIDQDGTVLQVTDAADRLGVSPRTLQRIARRYVGLPPAAMIRRRRLQEAADRLRTDPAADLATLAADLGYADQSHMTHDFRTVLAFTPGTYRGQQAGAPPGSPS